MLKVPVMGPLVQTEPPREMFLKGMNKKTMHCISREWHAPFFRNKE